MFASTSYPTSFVYILATSKIHTHIKMTNTQPQSLTPKYKISCQVQLNFFEKLSVSAVFNFGAFYLQLVILNAVFTSKSILFTPA